MELTQLIDRPLAVFDIEATGLNRIADRMVEISIIVLHPDGREEKHLFRTNPEMPIPVESTAIHGITDDDVKDSPTFSQIVDELEQIFDGKDIAGYNLIHFDIPMLENEFKRCKKTFVMKGRRVIDAQRIFHRKEPRDLTAALKFYSGEAHLGAHSAEDDVIATIKVIQGQLVKYDDLPETMDDMHLYCNPRDPNWADKMGRLKRVDGEILINFGRKQGQSVATLALKDPGFLRWIIKGDFPSDTKSIIQGIMDQQADKPMSLGSAFDKIDPPKT